MTALLSCVRGKHVRELRVFQDSMILELLIVRNAVLRLITDYKGIKLQFTPQSVRS